MRKDYLKGPISTSVNPAGHADMFREWVPRQLPQSPPTHRRIFREPKLDGPLRFGALPMAKLAPLGYFSGGHSTGGNHHFRSLLCYYGKGGKFFAKISMKMGM